jgi:SRSO17 transposase
MVIPCLHERQNRNFGHADRAVSLKLYCTVLLLPGERKPVEPMAARLAPDNVRRTHQSLHHVVADAAWSDEALLGCTRDYALAAMTRTGPVAAWIVDDTGLPKKGAHSVGVARQYFRRRTHPPCTSRPQAYPAAHAGAVAHRVAPQ